MTALPCLLNADLTPRADLHPLHLTVDRALVPLTTAELTLPISSPSIGVRDMIRISDGAGNPFIARVSAVTNDPGTRVVLTLEHALCTLRDDLVPPETFAASLRDTLTRYLACQTKVWWTLGDIDLPEDLNVSSISHRQSILAALMNLTDLLPRDTGWFFDQSVFPWKLHLRQLSSAPECEGRLTRNLSSVRISQDATALCTRVYPYGCGEGADRMSLVPLLSTDHLDADTISTWGVVAKTFTSQQIYDAATLRDVALRYLDRHKNPDCVITLRATDLAEITGEPYDSFRIGAACRIVLPDQQFAMTQHIVAIHLPDVFGQPGSMTLTLANRPASLADEIAELLRDVTADRLIGGHVAESVDSNRASGTYSSPVSHHFTLDAPDALLSCIVRMMPDSGLELAEVHVDSTKVPANVWNASLSFDALPYLSRSAAGLIPAGSHNVTMFPRTSGAISSTVTIKVIQ